MYYPYVRGRQYELLALKELVLEGRLSNKIVPIVEPVKLSPTLIKTLEAFVNYNKSVCVICNPAVGSFKTDLYNDEKQDLKDKFLDLLKSDKCIKTHIIEEHSVEILDDWKTKWSINITDWYIINVDKNFASIFNEIYNNQEFPKISFIPDESVFRRSIRKNRVLLEDRFEKCERNSDYTKNTDEFFSDDHLYYKDDGFIGFSDYSTIGKQYLESGFAPYAIAIHIVYFDKDSLLKVRHFVSNSNVDIQNPAGKFYEAVEKLKEWVDENKITPTKSLQVFIEHYNNQTYPGLGSAKKLSLMHHIELMGEYLDKEV